MVPADVPATALQGEAMSPVAP